VEAKESYHKDAPWVKCQIRHVYPKYQYFDVYFVNGNKRDKIPQDQIRKLVDKGFEVAVDAPIEEKVLAFYKMIGCDDEKNVTFALLLPFLLLTIFLS